MMSATHRHLLWLFVGVASVAWAKDVSIDFEAGIPPNAAQEGEIAIVADNPHGGASAVRIEPGAQLVLPVAEDDGFGTVTLWVYDSGLKLEGEAAQQRAFGPLWGLSNSSGQRLCFGLIYAPYLSGNSSYGWISTAENDWFSRRHARVGRQEGWHEWEFQVNNETDIVVTVDGREATAFEVMDSKFFSGFNAVYLRGAREMQEPLIADDIAVSWQQEPLTERIRPLPGESYKAPDVDSLPLRDGLVDTHPRLFFTESDIADIRERCTTTHKKFFEGLKSGADAYLGMSPPENAADCSNDQKMQQWGWWRLQTLAFAYVATGDERYGQHAIDWMETYASYEDWGRGGERNQSMGAGNMLTGMACAYDWCYDLMSDEQRTLFREKLLHHVELMYWLGFNDPDTAGYWKADHQNNHCHHRLSGLLLGALAVHGELPQAEAYASAAAEECRAVSDVFPPDGSNHEGPSYAAFGYSYVVRCFDALRHCTGVDLFAETPGLEYVPYFRAHTLVPGFENVFNFSDCGGGTYYFNHYLFRLAAEYEDGSAQALMDAACEASPKSFQYYPWDILWYDPDLERTALDEIPTWRYFEDLELATYRSSWGDPQALAVLLKCGPYGGHRLNEVEEGWFNVAHDHPDPNHFMIHWAGHLWAIDDGYPKRHKAGENHNIILVDGEGPAHRGAGWTQTVPNMASMGRIDHVVHQDDLFAARGDASEYYKNAETALRWLAVVRDKYIVIFDHLQSDEPRKFDWLLHSDAEFSQQDDGHFTLRKGGESLRLQFAAAEDLDAKLEDDVLEGKDRGTLLRVQPTEKRRQANFFAVFSRQEIPIIEATVGAEEIDLNAPDHFRLLLDPQTGAASLGSARNGGTSPQ